MEKHPFGTRLRLFDGVLYRTDFKAHVGVPIAQEWEHEGSNIQIWILPNHIKLDVIQENSL